MIVQEIRENRRFCCEDLSLIENYDKAISDTIQTWSIHHRLETHNSDGELRMVAISVKELKSLGMYYNRPASELIFLTATDHTKLHNLFLTFSEEAKRKMSESQKARKGHKQYMQTEEYKKAISEGRKRYYANGGYSRGSTGMRWFNNGIENVLAFECPEGFTKGRLPYKVKATHKPFSEKRRKRISESQKGKHLSEETKKKLSLNSKGRKWFNNGVISIMRFECPEGFVEGRLPRAKEN